MLLVILQVMISLCQHKAVSYNVHHSCIIGIVVGRLIQGLNGIRIIMSHSAWFYSGSTQKYKAPNAERNLCRLAQINSSLSSDVSDSSCASLGGTLKSCTPLDDKY